VINRDLWEIGYKKDVPGNFAKPPPSGGSKVQGFGIGVLGGLALIGLGAYVRRRRREER
jgi:LPXTG-motif cell wall-anchored protein